MEKLDPGETGEKLFFLPGGQGCLKLCSAFYARGDGRRVGLVFRASQFCWSRAEHFSDVPKMHLLRFPTGFFGGVCFYRWSGINGAQATLTKKWCAVNPDDFFWGREGRLWEKVGGCDNWRE